MEEKHEVPTPAAPTFDVVALRIAFYRNAHVIGAVDHLWKHLTLGKKSIIVSSCLNFPAYLNLQRTYEFSFYGAKGEWLTLRKNMQTRNLGYIEDIFLRQCRFSSNTAPNQK